MEHKGTLPLETDRLILRPFKVGDEEDMFSNYCNDTEACKYVTWLPHGKIEKTKEFLNNVILPKYEKLNTYEWALVDKTSGQVIGSLAVNDVRERRRIASIGYVIGRNFWNKGLMTEALKRVIDYLFEVGFTRVEAWHIPSNIGSGRVMQKAGMSQEGVLKLYDVDKDGIPQDCVMYAITNTPKFTGRKLN